MEINDRQHQFLANVIIEAGFGYSSIGSIVSFKPGLPYHPKDLDVDFYYGPEKSDAAKYEKKPNVIFFEVGDNYLGLEPNPDSPFTINAETLKKHLMNAQEYAA